MTKLKLSEEVLNIIYPIGSVYMSKNSIDPSTLFGGTWQRIKGRVIVGVDEDDTDFNVPLKTGGSKYIQEHQHKKITGLHKSEYTYGIDAQVYKAAQKLQDLSVWSGGVDGVPTGDSGNLQPYITLYIWIRTE